MPIRGQLERRYIVNTAGGSDGSLAAITLARQAVPTAPLTAADGMMPLLDIRAAKKARIKFVGAGSNNGTFQYTIYGIMRGLKENGTADDAEPMIFGTGTATLGTNVGVSADGCVRSDERVADTLTWTPDAGFTAAAAALGETGSDKYSPADNTVAYLVLNCLCRCYALAARLHTFTSVTRANLVVEKMTE